MKQRFHLIKTLFIVLMVASFMITGCKSKEKIPKEVKAAEKAEAAEQKQAELEYKNAVKHHHKIQSPQTKKEMKEMKKRQKKLNKVHRRSLWDRLFNPGCKPKK